MHHDPTIRSLRTDCKIKHYLDHKCVSASRFQQQVVLEGDLLDLLNLMNEKVIDLLDHRIPIPFVHLRWAVPLATFYLKL